MIHVARTELQHRFLHTGADLMFTFDADTQFDPSSATAMAKAIISGRGDVIGGAYVMSTGVRFALEYFPEDLEAKRFRGFELDGHRFIEMRAVGTGMFMASRRAVVRMIEQLPETRIGAKIEPRYMLFDFKRTQTEDENPVPSFRGEDFTFCDHARQVGLKVHCCTTAKTVHYVRHGYSGDMQKQLEEGGAEFDWEKE
jgi:hypothetical protein